MGRPVTRRSFVTSATTAGVGLALAGTSIAHANAVEKPALLGGAAVRNAKSSFPSWPVRDSSDEKAVGDVLRGGNWFRGGGTEVTQFEDAFARLLGAKNCIATANGTSALIASLGALGVGPGDEVIVPPYTFIATINAVVMHHALPIFVDTDPETFQIDPRKIEAVISDRTVAIVPVHMGGYAANLDAILEIGKRRNIPVIEDACQAVLGQWRGRKLGTLGTTGCFSFQVSKNLCSGEGGAIMTDDDALAEKCYAFHNNCRARKVDSYHFAYMGHRAGNFRMTEFQGALLQSQMKRTEAQTKLREANANYLTGLLREIPGIVPAKLYEGCTRSAYHLYMFRYQADRFHGLSRAKFIAALAAEGIPASGGYAPLDVDALAKELNESRGFRRSFPKSVLAGWRERTRCPENDRLCGEAVWFYQTMLLGTRADMDDIARAVRKIHAFAADLAK